MEDYKHFILKQIEEQFPDPRDCQQAINKAISWHLEQVAEQTSVVRKWYHIQHLFDLKSYNEAIMWFQPMVAVCLDKHLKWLSLGIQQIEQLSVPDWFEERMEKVKQVLPEIWLETFDIEKKVFVCLFCLTDLVDMEDVRWHNLTIKESDLQDFYQRTYGTYDECKTYEEYMEFDAKLLIKDYIENNFLNK